MNRLRINELIAFKLYFFIIIYLYLVIFVLRVDVVVYFLASMGFRQIILFFSCAKVLNMDFFIVSIAWVKIIVSLTNFYRFF